jgi:hypothetical protein
MQVRVSAVLTNAPFILNLDCDHYVNNSKAVREAMCFLMDPEVGRDVCYVQFPQRFDGIDRSDRYANRNTVFFDVSLWQSIIFLCDRKFISSNKYVAEMLFLGSRQRNFSFLYFVIKSPIPLHFICFYAKLSHCNQY